MSHVWLANIRRVACGVYLARTPRQDREAKEKRDREAKEKADREAQLAKEKADREVQLVNEKGAPYVQASLASAQAPVALHMRRLAAACWPPFTVAKRGCLGWAT